MRNSPERALETFVAAYGPGLDLDRAAYALDEAIAHLAGPRPENEIRKRQLEWKARQMFDRYTRATGVTRDELVAPSTGGGGHADHLTAHRDAFTASLVGSTSPRFSIHQVATLMGRSTPAIRKAMARHAARMRAVAATVPLGRVVDAGPERSVRSVGHG